MKVLITGAGGNLGRVVVPALAEKGHEPVLMDYRSIDTPYQFIQGDVTQQEDVRAAVQGVDAIVHAAALHGIHLTNHSRQDYWNLNVAGTFYIYEAAREASINKIVLCSTMGVYGRSLEASPDAWAWVHEGLPTLPTDIYGISKVLAEELGRYNGRIGRMRVVALRFGMYVPASFEHYGFRLLFGGVDERDVAHSVLLALEHEPDGGFDAFDIMADTPFAETDGRAMHDDPVAVLERHWPGST